MERLELHFNCENLDCKYRDDSVAYMIDVNKAGYIHKCEKCGGLLTCEIDSNVDKLLWDMSLRVKEE